MTKKNYKRYSRKNTNKFTTLQSPKNNINNKRKSKSNSFNIKSIAIDIFGSNYYCVGENNDSLY